MAQSSSNGIGFTGLLLIIFITLKLLGKIAWSWWWVLSPAWIAAILFVLVVFFIVIGVAIHEAVKKK
jgi:hypothetical protein